MSRRSGWRSNDKRFTIRKANHDAQDWLYIYLRSNVSERVEADGVSGEE